MTLIGGSITLPKYIITKAQGETHSAAIAQQNVIGFFQGIKRPNGEQLFKIEGNEPALLAIIGEFGIPQQDGSIILDPSQLIALKLRFVDAGILLHPEQTPLSTFERALSNAATVVGSPVKLAGKETHTPLTIDPPYELPPATTRPAIRSYVHEQITRIQRETPDRLARIEQLRLAEVFESDPANRARLLQAMYTEAAFFMDEMAQERHALIQAKFTTEGSPGRITLSEYTEASSRLNDREIQFFITMGKVAQAFSAEEGQPIRQSVLGGLRNQAAQPGQTALRNGLNYMKGRLYFCREIIKANYGRLSLGPLIRKGNGFLEASLASLGLGNDPAATGLLADIRELAAEERRIGAEATALMEQGERVGLDRAQRLGLRGELRRLDRQLAVLAKLRNQRQERLATIIQAHLQKSISFPADYQEQLLVLLDFRNNNPQYLEQTFANFEQAFRSVDGFIWTYYGQVSAKGEIIGDNPRGISCLGFAMFITAAVAGGYEPTTFPADVNFQADLIVGNNNDTPYPILTDLHSSVDPDKLTRFLASTGTFFTVQTYSPGISKTALHATVIYLDQQGNLRVAESTSLGRSGPQRISYEKWAKKQNRNGRGKIYNLTLIDPRQTPLPFAESPMARGLDGRGRDHQLATRN